jgi:hypothetical protein
MIVDFSLHDVLGAAEQIIKADKPSVLRDAASPGKGDLPGLVIVGLFLVLVVGSIELVNWYFRSTFGV